MKKLLLLVAMMSLLVPASFAGRNYAGIWGLNPTSLVAPVDTVFDGAALITIRMQGNKLTLISERPRIFNEYVLDGDDHKMSTRLGDMSYSSSWEGDTLVIKRTPGKNSGYKVQFLRFSVSEDGIRLRITCTWEGDAQPRDVLGWERR